MSSRAAPSVAAKHFVATGFTAAFGAALRRFTWKVVAVALAITAGLELWNMFENALDTSVTRSTAEVHLSFIVINLAMVFALVFTTLVADEMVERGSRRWPTYAWAIVVGCAVGTLAQWQLHQWLGMRTPREVFGAPRDVNIMQPIAVFFEYLIWGAMIVCIYVNRRTELLVTAQMNAAQLDRAQTQRRTLESRLQALQARIEPQFLSNALAQMRDLYDENPALGRRMLDDLSVYLRAALPHLRVSTSTLEKEFRLLVAYNSILHVRQGVPLELRVDAAEPLLTARLPAMILRPLLDQVVASARATPSEDSPVNLCARAEDGMLHIEISAASNHQPPCPDDALRDIRRRLTALYGDRGRLTGALFDGSVVRLQMEIPYEQADGRHR